MVDKKQEVARNYEAFKTMLPNIIEEHAGKFALLRKGEIIEYFDTARDALVFAREKYKDGAYSIQQVANDTVDLGWFSHAPHHATV